MRNTYYTNGRKSKTSIKVNNGLQGETIEQKVSRIVHNGEKIGDGAPLLFTERNEGVLSGYNIRTDRFEVALDGIDKINKSRDARRNEKADLKVIKNDNDNEVGGTESVQGTK